MTLLALFLNPAPAQEIEAEPTPREVRYKPRTEIEFGVLDVNAGVLKPSLTPTFEIRRAGFNPLIELRKDFQPEMRASVDAVK